MCRCNLRYLFICNCSCIHLQLCMCRACVNRHLGLVTVGLIPVTSCTAEQVRSFCDYGKSTAPVPTPAPKQQQDVFDDDDDKMNLNK
jgi:hypothetical protein